MEAGALAAGHAEHEHHGPPPANRSSRVDPSLLGMLLFIISEIMVFGAFFTAYFFIRVVQGAEWPAEGTELPKLIAGVNTAILISSSFTLHWAEHAHKMGNRRGLQAGHPHDVPARLHVPLHPDQRVRPHRVLAAGQRAGHDLLRAHRPARRARLHRPDAAAVRHDPRLPRPLHGRGAPRHRGAGHLLALRRRDVDRRLHDRLHHLGRGEPAALRGGGVPLPALRDRRRGRRGGRRAGDPRALSRVRATLGATMAILIWLLVAEALYVRALRMLGGRGVARAARADRLLARRARACRRSRCSRRSARSPTTC